MVAHVPALASEPELIPLLALDRNSHGSCHLGMAGGNLVVDLWVREYVKCPRGHPIKGMGSNGFRVKPGGEVAGHHVDDLLPHGGW